MGFSSIPSYLRRAVGWVNYGGDVRNWESLMGKGPVQSPARLKPPLASFVVFKKIKRKPNWGFRGRTNDVVSTK